MIRYLLILVLFPCCLLADDIITHTDYCNYDNDLEDALFSYPQNGNDDPILIGSYLNYEHRAIMKFDDQNVMDSINNADSSIYCTTFIKITVTGSPDSIYVYMVKKEWGETTSDWEDSISPGNWTTGGCGGDGTDRYAFVVGKIAVADKTPGDWLEIDCTEALDSIATLGYEWKGFLLKMKTISSGNYVSMISSEQGGVSSDPYIKWKYAYITPAGDAVTNRHGGSNRHSATRH